MAQWLTSHAALPETGLIPQHPSVVYNHLLTPAPGELTLSSPTQGIIGDAHGIYLQALTRTRKIKKRTVPGRETAFT